MTLTEAFWLSWAVTLGVMSCLFWVVGCYAIWTLIDSWWHNRKRRGNDGR